MSSNEQSLSRREQAKQERRVRIINAASGLLRKHPLREISVALIAQRAKVSPATVYNLFGTKAAVLLKVYDRDLETFQQHVDQTHSTDTLETIFDALSIAAEFYRHDPSFYREAMIIRASSPEEVELLSVVRVSRQAFWENLVGAAIDDGFLTESADARRLGLLLAHIMMGSLADWISGLISLDQLESNSRYGFAVSLLSFATPKAEKRFRVEIDKSKTRSARKQRATS